MGLIMKNSAAKNRARVQLIREQEENFEITCIGECGETKLAKGNFHVDRKNKTGFVRRCKVCVNRKRNKVQLDLLEKTGKVKCTQCKKEMEPIMFPENNRNILGVCPICLECGRIKKDELKMIESFLINIEQQEKRNRY